MYTNLIKLIIINVVSAHTTHRYGEHYQDNTHRPAVTVLASTQPYTNSNARRAIGTYGYGERAYESTANVNEKSQGHQHNEKQVDRRVDTSPFIVFPDQIITYKHSTTEHNELVSKFGNRINVHSNNGTNKTKTDFKAINNNTKSNVTQNATLSNEKIHRPIRKSDVASHIDVTKSHSTDPDCDEKRNIRITNHRAINETNDVKLRNKNDVLGNKENRSIADDISTVRDADGIRQRTEGDSEVWVWGIGNESTFMPNGLDDRASFTGDPCPKGQVKLADKCAVPD